MEEAGQLIVISGPSGAGKGTIVEQLLKDEAGNYEVSVSCTTRAPRGQEKEGVNYFFKSREEFEKMIENNEFLEYADVFGCCYGTPKEYVLNKMKSGKSVILEIDVQGALQVKKNYPKALMIFILPPSEKVLLCRLKGRKTETEEQIAKRFGKAKDEMAFADRYDHTVINDDLSKAVDEVNQIIRKNR